MNPLPSTAKTQFIKRAQFLAKDSGIPYLGDVVVAHIYGTVEHNSFFNPKHEILLARKPLNHGLLLAEELNQPSKSKPKSL
jgi:hypothetical protein